MAPSADADRLTAIATELQAEPSETITTSTIVQRAVGLLPDADHASLTVHGRRGTYRTIGSTADLASEADQVQYGLREGPCVESAEGIEWLRSGDVRRDERWPQWGPAAAELGVGSVLSIRLRTREQAVGALNLYAGSTGAFSKTEQVELASLFAVHAAQALRTARLVTGLETALSSRHQIGMAQGILMERFALSPDQSFAMLQRVSSVTNRKLRDLAEDIVETGSLPEIPQPSPTARRTEPTT